MKRLIVAPHADDETLGCGGLIAKHPDECMVVVLSDKGDGREGEFHRARKILGYDRFLFMGEIPTGELTHRMREITGLLDQIQWEFKPDYLYLPFPATHQDHIAAYEAGVRSSRLGFQSKHWYPSHVLAYDVSAYPINLYQTGLQWNHFMALEQEHIDAKVEAFAQYDSQNDLSRPQLLADEARVIGAQHRVPYAEKFALVRAVHA